METTHQRPDKCFPPRPPSEIEWRRAKTVETYLGHTILDLGLQLLLRAEQALPDLLADAAALQQRVERLLARADVDDAVDVLGAAGEQGGA